MMPNGNYTIVGEDDQFRVLHHHQSYTVKCFKGGHAACEEYVRKQVEKHALRDAEIEKHGPLPDVNKVQDRARSLIKMCVNRVPAVYILKGESDLPRWRKDLAVKLKAINVFRREYGDEARTIVFQLQRLERAGMWHPSRGNIPEMIRELQWATDPIRDVSEWIAELEVKMLAAVERF